MAHLSEHLVVEYYNRQRFFTIHGARQGVHESDILAVRLIKGNIEAHHVEVQTSFRPVGNLSNKKAGKRSPEQTSEDMRNWLDKKYRSEAKRKLREIVWPGVSWQFVFVCARLKDARELVEMKNEGITLISFRDILKTVAKKTEANGFTALAGGDMSEILRYYEETD